jgi:hypothetical protein
MAGSAVLGLGVFAGTASAAATPAHAVSAHAPAKHEYCAVLLAPQRSAHSAAHALKRTCSTQHAAGSVRPLGFAAAATSYAVFTEYQYTNFNANGGYVLTFYKSSACPARGTTGWTVSDTRPSSYFSGPAGDWGASSWKASNGCWATTLYYGTGFGGPKYQYAQGTYEAGQIGSPWDNHVWSVWTGYER